MANFNKVLLMGNLTRDPEVRYTPKGTAIAALGLAINRKWTGEDGQAHEEVTFVDVDLWGRQAEVAQQYLHKGSPIFIEGRLKYDQWDDKQTGQKRSRLKVTGERIQLLGAPRGGKGEVSDEPPPARPASRPAPRATAPPPADAGEAPPEDDNIPF